MSETDRIRRQLERAFHGPAWHGDSVFDVLGRISVEDATHRPVPDAHSIIELVLHTAAWLRIARLRTAGQLVAVSDEMDWPSPTSGTGRQWAAALADLRASVEELDEAIDAFRDEDLEAAVEGKVREYTVYEELHGAIQHSLYHLGQIVLLAKPGLSGAKKA